MKTLIHGLWIMTLFMTACSAANKRLDYEQVRLELDSVRNDPVIQRYAPEELRRASLTMRELELVQGRKEEKRAHLVYLIERYIDIARARASERNEQTVLLELQREYDKTLLQASLHETEMARREAERLRASNIVQQEETRRALASAQAAQNEADEVSRRNEEIKQEAEQARRLAAARAEQAELARKEAELASATADALRQQLESMEAESTNRGLLFTLGDVTFEKSKAEIRPEAIESLEKLVTAINENPDRRVSIEGHTDSTGSESFNISLSQRRADNVKKALIERGISASRMDAVGLGEEFPVADNATDTGRQRNRRVDVIILNDDD